MLTKLYNLLFPLPRNCPVCMKPAETLSVCSDCKARMLQKRKLYGQCRRCGSFGVDSNGCRTCEDWGDALRKNTAVWPHEGDWQQLVLDYKFRQMPWLAEVIAGEMVPFLEEPGDVIIPVPLHRNRLQERGYNQSILLAKALSKRTGIPWENALIRLRDTPHQTGGNRMLRQHNLKGAFAVRKPFAIDGKKVLLVDDVLTTGATLLECSKTLRQAGAASVDSITVAAGRTRESDMVAEWPENKMDSIREEKETRRITAGNPSE